MERPEAIQIIKNSCSAIAAELIRLHPAVGGLGNQALQDQIVQALFQLTKDLETVKKLVRKAETAE